MPRFVIERQYLVPVYEHILVEAPSLEEACQRAADDGQEPWGDDARTDYESARATTIERIVKLPDTMVIESFDDRSLSHLLYDAKLELLPVPPEFVDLEDRASTSVGFV